MYRNRPDVGELVMEVGTALQSGKPRLILHGGSANGATISSGGGGRGGRQMLNPDGASRRLQFRAGAEAAL